MERKRTERKIKLEGKEAAGDQFMGGRKEKREKKERKKKDTKGKERGRRRREEEGHRTSVVQWSDPNKLGMELCYEM